MTASLETHRRRDRLQAALQATRRERDKLTGRKKHFQQELNRAVQEFASLHHKTEHLQAGIDNNQKLLDNLNAQLHEIDNTLQQDNLSYQEHILQLRVRFDEVTSHLSALQTEFNTLTDEMNRAGTEYNQHNIHCIQQQNKIAGIIRDHGYKVELEGNLQRNITANVAELDYIQEQIRELLQSSTDFDGQLLELYAEKEELEKSVSLVETEFYRSRGEIDELENRIRQIRHQREQCDQLAQAIKERTTELKIQLNSLKERLSVEFNIDINDILEHKLHPTKQKRYGKSCQAETPAGHVRSDQPHGG